MTMRLPRLALTAQRPVPVLSMFSTLNTLFFTCYSHVSIKDTEASKSPDFPQVTEGVAHPDSRSHRAVLSLTPIIRTFLSLVPALPGIVPWA